MRNAFGWLYAIAGFTLVNTIAMVGGMQFRMLVGLGASLLATAVFWRSGAVGVAISVMATLVAAGGFAYLGYLAQKKASRVALLVGAVVYALDTALLELGLPYEQEPAVTRHALAFLEQGLGEHEGRSDEQPDQDPRGRQVEPAVAEGPRGQVQVEQGAVHPSTCPTRGARMALWALVQASGAA